MRPRWIVRLLPMVSVGLAGCADRQATAAVDLARWREVKQEIRSKFEGVEHLDTAAVRAALAGEEPPLLVDVRSEDEFAVSHLPGARHLPEGASLDGVPKDREIVVYCSVGYRSAIAAARLRAEGFENVRNYIGSIFEWANEGYPLEADSGAVSRVHPYDAKWGRLLRPERRADLSRRSP